MNSLAGGIRTDPPARCPQHFRHWFSVWGQAGLRSPVCTRCGGPNPRPLTDDEWANLIHFRDYLMDRPFRLKALEDAVNARKAEVKP